MKKQKINCRHDYRNAIKVGNIDYQCPLCGKLLDPNEWFFMNSFEFIDVDIQREAKIKKSKKEKPKNMPANKKGAKRGGGVVGKARKNTEKELGRSVIPEKAK